MIRFLNFDDLGHGFGLVQEKCKNVFYTLLSSETVFKLKSQFFKGEKHILVPTFSADFRFSP